jgi:hypothetical protein
MGFCESRLDQLTLTAVEASDQTMRTIRFIGLRLAIVLFGLLLAVFIAEILIRAFYPSLPMGLQIALRDVHVSPFSDQRLAPPPLWQSDKDYLTIVRPGAENSLQAGSPTVTFNVSTYAWWGGRVGFRSPQPQDGNVQAVAVGDSFTFCFTNFESCWVTKTASDLNVNISNLGQPVTGSVSHQRIYYDFVAKPELNLKQPKLVLWQFYGNDSNDDYGLALLNGTAKTPAVPTPASRPLPQGAVAGWLRQNSALYTLISTLLRGRDPNVEVFVDPYHIQQGKIDLWVGQSYIRDSFDITEPRNQEGIALSEAAILQIRQIVEENGGLFVVVIMPAKEEVYRELAELLMGKDAIDKIAAPRLHMLDFCTEQKLTCFDSFTGLKVQANRGNQVYFSADPHLNELGNKVVADTLVPFLKKLGE